MISKTPEYRLWISIKSRCYPTKNISTPEERNNIEMCNKWKESFHNFLSDIGYKPTKLHRFIRLNTNKDFSPENCIWSITKNQVQSNSRFIKINNEIILLREYCKMYNIKYTTALMQIKRKGCVTKTPNNIVERI